VIAAIHWEALWIWLKGARLQPDTRQDRPSADAHLSRVGPNDACSHHGPPS
jgi:DUF1365 family protein